MATAAHLRRYLPIAKRSAIVTVQLLCLVHLVNSNLFEIRPCHGASMLPTLSHHGDYILHERISPRLSPPRIARGDLVVALAPSDPSRTVCKRVLGCGGDAVCVDPRDPEGAREWVRVPKGHLWLAGDNLANSTDSRTYGPVPLGLVKGKVVARVWPNPTWLANSDQRIS